MQPFKRKNILSYLLGFIAVIMVYTAFITPFTAKIKNQQKQIDQKKALIEKSRSAIDKKDKLNSTYSLANKKIQAKLPSQGGENSFLTAIGQVAEKTNVHIESMNPKPIKELGFFNELSVEINMQANLGNLVRFLYEMRKSSVVLVANRLNLRPISERSALLKGHLEISTIFLKDR